MSYFISVYLAGILIVITIASYFMAFKLDEFDWQYHKNKIWKKVIVSSLFWPVILIFNTRSLFNASAMFDFDIILSVADIRVSGLGKKMRELAQLSKAPPPCSSTIYYHYKTTREANLWFNHKDIITYYTGTHLPLHSEAEKSALSAWLKNHDSTIQHPTEVPEIINFNDTATDLLEKGYGIVECRECNKRYKAGELNRETPPLQPGWNFAYFYCPEGHLLLDQETVHIYAPQNPDGETMNLLETLRFLYYPGATLGATSKY